jgi:outer membrane murein-binding lipoprotein Lpp
MKKTLNTILAISGLVLFSGCTNVKVPVSHQEVVASKAYKHIYSTVDVPYTKAVRNFKKGLHMCAENVNTPSLVEVGTGAVRMPGNTAYHTFERVSSKKSVYAFRLFMGGVIIGDCMVCQPKGGIYRISSSVEKLNAKQTKLAIHTGDLHMREARAITKWVKGDLSSCHGFAGKE